MRISSVTDYILKLEKLNQESREKIDSLKELFLKSEEEKVSALRELNELKQKPTVSRVTLIPDETCPINEEIANHLMLISLKESDVYKARAYKNAAGIIAKLTYEVTDGISCAKRTKGIGPSIAAKIDEFLDNYYNSEDDSDYDSDAESVASNDTGSFYSTDDEDSEDDMIHTNDYIADELAAETERYSSKDPFRSRAYAKASKIIRDLDFEVTCGADVYEGDKKIPGIGKSIAKKIDEILHSSSRPSQTQNVEWARD